MLTDARAAGERAVAGLVRAQGEIDQQFADAIRLVRSAMTALENGDRAEASRLLTAAVDIEHELTGDTKAAGPMFDALGLEDGAKGRVGS